MKSVAFASAVLCAACFHPPAEPEFATADGPIPVLFTNNSPAELCSIEMVPSFTKMPRTATKYVAKPGQSPSLQPGQSVRVNVKAGTYRIHAGNCSFSVNSVRQDDEFDIAGPFAVDFDKESPSAPPGYQRLTLGVKYHSATPEPEQANCLPAGARLSYPPDGSKCCSGHYSYPGVHDELSKCT